MKNKWLAILTLLTTLALATQSAQAATGYGGTIVPDNDGNYTISAEPGQTVTLASPDTAVSAIAITFDSDVEGTCEVNVSSATPSQGAPAGASNFYISVNCDEAIDAAMQSAQIRFAVDKSWLNTNNIAKDAVKLLHYTGGSWTELTTTIVSESSTQVNYSATTPSFSDFVVNGTPSTTAATGFNLVLLMGAAGLLLTSGVTMLIAARRQTT